MASFFTGVSLLNAVHLLGPFPPPSVRHSCFSTSGSWRQIVLSDMLSALLHLLVHHSWSSNLQGTEHRAHLFSRAFAGGTSIEGNQGYLVTRLYLLWQCQKMFVFCSKSFLCVPRACWYTMLWRRGEKDLNSVFYCGKKAEGQVWDKGSPGYLTAILTPLGPL